MLHNVILYTEHSRKNFLYAFNVRLSTNLYGFLTKTLFLPQKCLGSGGIFPGATARRGINNMEKQGSFFFESLPPTLTFIVFAILIFARDLQDY